MLIFCEECGERYSFSMGDIDPEKESFQCGKCGFLIKLDRKGENKDSEDESSGEKMQEKVSET